MKRLAGLVFLVVATAALADWWPISVPGVPKDVEIADAGHFAIALSPTTGPGAQEIIVQLADGGTTSRNASTGSPAVNAYLYPFGGSFCLSYINEGGPYVGCGEGYDIGQNVIERVRHTSSGAAYLAACPFGPGVLEYASNTRGNSPPYVPLSALSFPCSDAVSAIRLGMTNFGLFGLDPQPGTAHVWLLADQSQVGNEFALQQIRDIADVALFDMGALPGGLVAGREGLELLTFTPSGGSSAVIDAGAANMTGVAFATGTGVGGEGFGMAISQLDAGSGALDGGVFSAIPDPANPARSWVRNTVPLPANLAGPVVRVMCQGGRFCVLLTDRAGGSQPNVVLYDNARPPSFELDGGVLLTLNEGDTATTVATVLDGDGDAVYVTWGTDARSGPLTVSPVSSLDGRAVSVSAGTGSPLLCGKDWDIFYVTGNAFDGFHKQSQLLPVRVNHTLRPPAPAIAPSSWTVDAGDPPVTFQASPGPMTSCPTTIAWSEVGDAGFAWSATGGTLTVTPPRTYCDFRGGTGTYVAQAMELGDGGVLSDAGAVTVTVLPWGPPNAAFPPGYTLVQDGGTVAQYGALELHDCDNATNFPGVQTTWTLDARGLDASIGLPGGPLGPGPVVTNEMNPKVTLWVPNCVLDAGVTLFATNEVLPPAPYLGPTSSVEVQIRAAFQSVSGFPPMLAVDRYDEATGTVSGSVSTGLNCPRERGLQAALSVIGPDGALLVDKLPVNAPGPFALSLPGGCGGGTFQLTGFLFDGMGTGPAVQVAFDGGIRPVAIDRVAPDNIPATCEGVNGQLQIQLAATSCPTGSFAWAQTGGPPVELAAAGTEATVTSRDAGLNELVGQFLSFHVSASAGPGTDTSLDTSVQIVAEPFVKVRHRTEVPVSSESGITGVAVRLENQAGCPVSGVTFLERLDGLTFLSGTARVAGQPVEAALSEGELEFSGLDLPAGGSVELSFLARPRLLSTPRPSGQAFLRGVPVSEREGLEAAPPPGCGCAGAPGELAACALAVLGLLARRRSVRTRS